MELVYLWVKKYKNIKEQGFNFSPRFHCEYDEKNNELTIDENDDYIENFFGDNINVTAIVGKNGSGKSSLVEYLNQDPKVFILFENNKFYISQNLKINNLTKYLHSIKNDKSNRTHILSTRMLNSKDVFKQNNRISKEQIYMFLNSKNSLKNIIYPKKILYIIQIYKEDLLKYKHKLFSIFSKEPIPKISLSDMIYFSMFNQISFHEQLNDLISLEKLHSYIKRSQDVLSIKDLFLNFEKELENKEELDYYLSLKKYALLFDSFINMYQYTEYMKLGDYIIEVNTEEYICPIPLNKLTKEILDEIYYQLNHFFRWDIKLSSGETALINLLAQIFDILKLELDELPFNFLYIDEGESFLHPNWQKKYLSYIVQFIKDNFPDRKIHVILTTHSPFLLSDIPKQNIIFLDKDEKGNCKVVNGLKEKKQTFGANIHTLLSDSFFMEDGLMGEFAKSKIDGVIKLLNKDKLNEEEIKHCEQIISIIGEPIVKNQLERMLSNKKISYLAKDTREEIEFLKHRIDLLSKRL